MNGPGDIPLTHNSTPDNKPCGLISIIPTLGMSSCRGRAEAFARRLSSKLRTLGSQTDDDPTSQEDEPIINGGSTNTWITNQDTDQAVTDLQPLRHESDSFFDFDCELESPGSPVDECEYLRLIETTSNTPHNSAAESGYACASAASSHSSSDVPYFDANTENAAGTQHPLRITIPVTDIPNYVGLLKINGSEDRLTNGPSEDVGVVHEEANEIAGPKENLSEGTTTEATSTETPTNGPNVLEVLPQPQSEPTSAEELSTSEMIQMQHDIISELQKQSDNFIDTSESTPKGEEVIDSKEGEESQQTESSQDNHEVIHNITNGHSENDEEVLQIEVIDIQKDQTQKSESVLEDIEKERVPDNEETAISPEPPTQIEAKESENKTEDKAKERSHHSGLDTTDDEDECRPQRVRRCSSLKTGKTPPGTPGRKKIVRFADVLGLDLADVKTFLDEVPTIPRSAFEDLEVLESEPPIQLGPKSDKLLMPLFQQPGGLPTFLDIVREKQVSLENAAVSDHVNQTITGSVRVRNLDFHKSVHVRYSLDNWRSFADLQANYVENSCDGFSDKFSFVIFGNTLHIGQRLEMAVRFQCKGQQYWDNNYGTNYCFQCLPTSTPTSNPIAPIVTSHHAPQVTALLSPTAGDAWCSSFY